MTVVLVCPETNPSLMVTSCHLCQKFCWSLSSKQLLALEAGIPKPGHCCFSNVPKKRLMDHAPLVLYMLKTFKGDIVTEYVRVHGIMTII